jgi:hypothetical protein
MLCSLGKVIVWQARGSLGRLHGKHGFSRSHRRPWIAMAIDAPLHVERLSSPHQWHRIHATMTGHTSDPFRDVNAVIEVNEIREIVHPIPSNGLAGAKAGADRL